MAVQNPDMALPGAYGGSQFGTGLLAPAEAPAFPNQHPPDQAADPSTLLTFLQAHTQGIDYLVAVPSAQIGAPLVLATGRPVLYIGGFSGSDPVIDAEGLAELVAAGRLRYVLFGGRAQSNQIGAWLQTHCAPVAGFREGTQVLYECVRK